MRREIDLPRGILPRTMSDHSAAIRTASDLDALALAALALEADTGIARDEELALATILLERAREIVGAELARDVGAGPCP